MSAICNFFKNKFFTPAPPSEKLPAGPKIDIDPYDNDLNSHDPKQTPKVVSSGKTYTRHPASFYARAVMWECTSWMNPPIEELNRDRGPILNKLKPLGSLGRGVARLIYTLTVPTFAGLVGVAYHPVKGFYQLCRAGLYKIKSIIKPDERINKVAEDALILANEHREAALFDFAFTLIAGCSCFLGPIASAFKCLDSPWMTDWILPAAFGYRDFQFKAAAEKELTRRDEKYNNHNIWEEVFG